MNEGVRRAELARFLRARRAAIKPIDCGLSAGSRRRTPGLRREEVAARANVGVTWYTWLEQSREIQVSREVVSRIATALCLSSSDRTYLESLTGVLSGASEQPREEALAEVQDLLDGFSAGPAMLWNYRFDCIAYNHLADEIYDWASSPEPFGRNMIWRTFMDPKRQDLYSEAEHVVHNAVGMLRSRYVSHLGEPDFEPLIDNLRDGSELFRRLWTEQHTASVAALSLVMAHHKFGRLALRSIRAIFPPIPESTLVFVCPLDHSTKNVFMGLHKTRDDAVRQGSQRPHRDTRSTRITAYLVTVLGATYFVEADRRWVAFTKRLAFREALSLRLSASKRGVIHESRR